VDKIIGKILLLEQEVNPEPPSFFTEPFPIRFRSQLRIPPSSLSSYNMSESKEQRLWQACTEGDLEVVKELGNDPSVDVNWGDSEYERTPLYRACGHGRTSVVEYLVTIPGIDLHKPNSEGGTPFIIACQEGHQEIVRCLLKTEGIACDAAEKGGCTPLNMACQNGQKEIVALLLADPRVDPNRANNRGSTPFWKACQDGHKEVVSLLLADPRVDPDRQNDNATTPFLIACENGHKGVVSMLLADPRIDPNKPKGNQSTSLWFASQNGHLVVVQLLLASDREIHTRMRSTLNDRTAAEQGRAMDARTKRAVDTEEDHQRKKTYGPLCADLIDQYEGDPVAVRHRLRRQRGVREDFIGHLFALVVFHTDNFVVIRENEVHADTRRFFTICARFPLDLQMLLCNRAFGSAKDIVPSRDSEPGFKWLARTTSWE